jgi:hypothetical protein
MAQADLPGCMYGNVPRTQPRARTQHAHLGCCVDDIQRKLSATHASDSANSTVRLYRHAQPIEPPCVRPSEPRPRRRRITSSLSSAMYDVLQDVLAWGNSPFLGRQSSGSFLEDLRVRRQSRLYCSPVASVPYVRAVVGVRSSRSLKLCGTDAHLGFGNIALLSLCPCLSLCTKRSDASERLRPGTWCERWCVVGEGQSHRIARGKPAETATISLSQAVWLWWLTAIVGVRGSQRDNAERP